jgi:hypothetical protein
LISEIKGKYKEEIPRDIIKITSKRMNKDERKGSKNICSYDGISKSEFSQKYSEKSKNETQIDQGRDDV